MLLLQLLSTVLDVDSYRIKSAIKEAWADGSGSFCIYFVYIFFDKANQAYVVIICDIIF